MKQLLLIVGALVFLLGTGYNVYDWNTSGRANYIVQLVGLFLILIAISWKDGRS
jgi:hypothetical protein